MVLMKNAKEFKHVFDNHKGEVYIEVEKLVLDCNIDVEVQVFHHMLMWYGFFLIEG